jgi:hypothetical protein
MFENFQHNNTSSYLLYSFYVYDKINITEYQPLDTMRNWTPPDRTSTLTARLEIRESCQKQNQTP